MQYIKDHIPITINKRPGRHIIPEYITIHSTANPSSTAKNERDWLLNPQNTRVASWHICIDENQAIEAIPLSEMAYHAGTDKGNSTSIGVEMCESGHSATVISNTADLVAGMLHERHWGVDRLKRHYDWSGKNCPRILNERGWQGWEEFKTAVEIKLSELINKEENMSEVKVYNKIEDLPEWARNDIKLLVTNKLLFGDEKGNLGLTGSDLKPLAVSARIVRKIWGE